MKGIDGGKATGLDNIPCKFLKITADVAASSLTPYLLNERSGHSYILLCLTPDDFTRQWGTPGTGKG